MGRRALFSETEVLAKAEEMAAQGKDVSAISLLRELGGGSLSTMQKHAEKWQAGQERRGAPATTEMPEAIRGLFDAAWKAMEAEASKKTSRFQEFCDAEIERYKREAGENGAYALRLERENDNLDKANQELRNTAATQGALVQELRGRVEHLETSIGSQQRKFEEQEGRLRAELQREREQRIADLAASTSVEKKHAAEVAELRTQNANLTAALERSQEQLAAAQAAELAARETSAVLRGQLEQQQKNKRA